MSIRIIEVTSPQDRKEFVMLPFSIYKNNTFWIPPMINGEIDNISPDKNPFFKHCEAKFWIAKRGDTTVGRIGAIIPYKYIEKTGEKLGRITRPEFYDDIEAVDALFNTAEEWIRSKGMAGITGPLGFSNVDTQALLVEGFDQLPSVASVYHLPYYKTHFERLGYKKLIDWVEFNLFLENTFPERAERLAEIVKKRYNLRVVRMKDSKMMKNYGHEIFKLLNESFNDLFSFIPFDDDQIEYILKSYLPVINPEFVHIVFNEHDTIVGFIIPVPSLSKAMQIANGHLSLRAIWAISRSRKKNDIVDLFLTGIAPEYQPKGVASLLITEAYRVMIKHHIKIADTTGMLENNQKAIQNWKNFEHDMNKRKRCYIKMFV